MDGMLEKIPAPLLDEWIEYLKVRAWEEEQAAKKARK